MSKFETGDDSEVIEEPEEITDSEEEEEDSDSYEEGEY